MFESKREREHKKCKADAATSTLILSSTRCALVVFVAFVFKVLENTYKCNSTYLRVYIYIYTIYMQLHAYKFVLYIYKYIMDTHTRTHDMFVFSSITEQGVLEGDVDTLANGFKA